MPADRASLSSFTGGLSNAIATLPFYPGTCGKQAQQALPKRDVSHLSSLLSISAQIGREFDHRSRKNFRGAIALWNPPSLVRSNGLKVAIGRGSVGRSRRFERD
jgi:hypothetical protein